MPPTLDVYDNIDVIMERGAELVHLYRTHPVIAAYELLGVDLAPVQRVVLRDMWHKSYTISVMGRGGGKTYMLGVNAVLHALLYPGYRVGLIAPSFRQSKMMFAEVEKLYNRSPILQEATEKKPTRGADACFLKFRSTPETHGSYIEALPIGVDGAKIRGSRFYLIEIDELAQMPSHIIDLVVRPMGAVSLEPMKKVREMEHRKKLIESGLAQEGDFIDEAANKMIMASSGYFKFNHMWNRMKSYWQAIEQEGAKTRYAVHQVPYQMMPEGFLDTENIKEAQRVMSTIEFIMEYEAVMVSDSDGFFKASLLSICNAEYSLKEVGTSGKDYVLGVDPNQGGSAACGMVMIELGDPNKVILIKPIMKKGTPKLVQYIQELTEKFNIIKIFMDSQGGGNPIRDLLREGYMGKTPILDMEDEAAKGKHGRRILQLANPTTQWISDANYDTLAMLENKEVVFPLPPPSTTASVSDEKVYEDVKLLKSQMLNIVVTETARGARHFDTPKKGQNKDLYSAMILACWGVRDMVRSMTEDDKILYDAGLVREHDQGARFVSSVRGDATKFAGAVLKKPI